METMYTRSTELCKRNRRKEKKTIEIEIEKSG